MANSQQIARRMLELEDRLAIASHRRAKAEKSINPSQQVTTMIELNNLPNETGIFAGIPEPSNTPPMPTVQPIQTKSMWVAMTNTDCTEGRGYQFPYVVCEIESTARRIGRGNYIQGSDCPVVEVQLTMVDGIWMAPITKVAFVHAPTADDLKLQQKIDARLAIIAKAKAAGLTDADIKLLSM